jgi:hypothetical protein
MTLRIRSSHDGSRPLGTIMPAAGPMDHAAGSWCTREVATVNPGNAGVELLLAPDCPNAASARRVVAECLDEIGLAVPVVERVGDYPSPTVLVDGVDVMTGAVGIQPASACRLDIPTKSRVLAALRARA